MIKHLFWEGAAKIDVVLAPGHYTCFFFFFKHKSIYCFVYLFLTYYVFIIVVSYLFICLFAIHSLCIYLFITLIYVYIYIYIFIYLSIFQSSAFQSFSPRAKKTKHKPSRDSTFSCWFDGQGKKTFGANSGPGRKWLKPFNLKVSLVPNRPRTFWKHLRVRSFAQGSATQLGATFSDINPLAKCEGSCGCFFGVTPKRVVFLLVSR